MKSHGSDVMAAGIVMGMVAVALWLVLRRPVMTFNKWLFVVFVAIYGVLLLTLKAVNG